jgi:cytochrome c553
MAADEHSIEAGCRVQLALFLGAVAILMFALVGRSNAADRPPLEEQVVVCDGCHGEKGISTMPEAPSLAGQPVLYTQIQLFLFREGQRVNPVMSPMALGLTDDELTALSEWYAKLTPPLPAEAVPDPMLDTQGRALAAAHRCGACHLPDYSGRDQIPRIAAQQELYLLQALRDYKTGARAGDGAQMAEVVYALSEDDLKALAHHIAHLR